MFQKGRTGMLTVELYDKNELELSKIAKLWELSFGRKFDFARWEWFLKRNPFHEKIYIGYVLSGNELVSYSAIQPSIINIKGKGRINTGNMNMWMTHPDFRKKRFLQATLMELISELKQDNYSCLYSFPTRESSWNLMKKYLDWNDIFDLIIFQFSSKDVSANLSLRYYNFEVGVMNYNVVKKLNDMIFTAKQIYIERNKEFLNWKFVENPSNTYCYLNVNQSDKTLLTLIYKKFGNSIDVMEVFYDKVLEQKEYYEILMKSFCYCILKIKVDIVNLWVVKDSENYHYFKNAGIKESELVTHFGIVSLKNIDELNNKERWHLSFMDSDVY
jgi:hypothetical protein